MKTIEEPKNKLERKYFNSFEDLKTSKYNLTKCGGYMSTNHHNNSLIIEIPFAGLEHVEKEMSKK